MSKELTSCLSEYGLDRHLLGLESEEERLRSIAHIDGCQACQRDVDAWHAAASMPVTLPDVQPGLWDRIAMWWEQGQMQGFALAGAAALVVVMVFAWQRPDPNAPNPSGISPPMVNRRVEPAPQGWRIKGSHAPLLLVQRVREGKIATLQRRGTFHDGDEVRIQFKWLAGRFVFLLHRDAKGALTALYPASAKRRSAAIHQGGVRTVPDSFTVSGPTAGDEEILGCFSNEALSWKQVKQSLSTKEKPGPKARCRWLRFVMKRSTQ